MHARANLNFYDIAHRRVSENVVHGYTGAVDIVEAVFQLSRTDRLPSRMSHSQTARTRLLRIGWVNTVLFGFFFTAFNICLGQTRDVVSDDGYGRFETKFVSGVIVTVGAAKSGGLAKRSCSGTLPGMRKTCP
jgi:hypothetical protein